MTIIRVRRRELGRYTLLPNEIVEDRRLTFEARGLLWYLLSKPDHWQVQIADIQRAGGVGRDKAYSLVTELTKAGYLQQVKTRDETGKYVSHEYVVRDEPLPEKPEVDPLPEKPYPAEPDPANPDLSNNSEEAMTDSPPARGGGGERTHPRTGRRLHEPLHLLPDGWRPRPSLVTRLSERYPNLPEDLDGILDHFRCTYTDPERKGGPVQRSDWNPLFEQWVHRQYGEFAAKRRAALPGAGYAGAKDRAAERRPDARTPAGAGLDERLDQQYERVLAKLRERQAALPAGPLVNGGPAPRKNGAA